MLTFDKFGKVLLILLNFGEQFHALLDNVLPDDLQDLILLESLSRDVERKILRVDDT